MNPNGTPQGRGTGLNPPNRFEPLHLAGEEECLEEWELGDTPRTVKTVYYEDLSETILNWNDSPDVGFDVSLNPYRGCEHGCIYCYARPFHEFLGFSPGLDFETRIMVKSRAPDLLRAELSSRSWKPQVIAMSGVTDCYQPVERKLKITRRCLEVLREFRNPVGIVTKNRLVARDIDLLSEMSSWGGVVVFVSVTTLKEELWKAMEPRTPSPTGRLETLEKLSRAGIPVGLMMAPIIPGLTDDEIPLLLKAARDAGARWAGYTVVRLPFAVKDLFAEWLKEHFPERQDRVLKRIREVREGSLNDSAFGQRMRGKGWVADGIRQLFEVSRKRWGYESGGPNLSTDSFRRTLPGQMEFW